MKTNFFPNWLRLTAVLILLLAALAPADSAHADSTYSISGQLFYDNNGNGILDGDDYFTYFGETIHLDQGCDGSVDSSFILTYYVQTYTFADLPANQSYCVSYYNPGYRTTTPKQVTASLTEDMTGVNVGFRYVILGVDESALLNGSVGVEYQGTVAVTGGDGPYNFTGTDWDIQPDGLSFTTDAAAGTLTISGTPTAAGAGQIHLAVGDANGAYTQQTVGFWIQTDATATFTSSQNSSDEGQPVTFSLEFQPDYIFAGPVTFYDGDTPIAGCSDLIFAKGFGFWGIPDINPVTCSTSALSAGTHQIKAEYTGYYGGYKSNTYTIEQVVNGPYQPMTFSPATFPDGSLGAAYNQTITVSGGRPPYTFQNGSEQWLPSGLNLDTSTGSIVISGTPTEAGQATLDVYVYDQTGQYIEIQPAFWIKTDPTLTLTSSLNPSLEGQEVTFSLGSIATVANYPPAPWGQVTFYADGAVIPGCDGLWLEWNREMEVPAPNPVTCSTSTLAAGSHAITAALTTVYGPYNDSTATLPGGQTVNAPTPQYQSGGFTAPVDLGNVLNSAKAGQMIPLKWRLLDASGNPVTNLDSASVSITVSPFACEAGASMDAIETYATGTSVLQNLGDGYYQMNWKSDKAWVNTCKKLTLKIGAWSGDGFAALFQFKK